MSDFLRGSIEIAGITLRPFSMRCRINCLSLGLTMFTHTPDELEAQGIKLTEADREAQTIAFVWERSSDMHIVRRAIDNGTAQEAIYEFGETLCPSALPAIVAEINRISAIVQRNSVTVVPRNTDGDKDAPGN
jgi:hypothetical protein